MNAVIFADRQKLIKFSKSSQHILLFIVVVCTAQDFSHSTKSSTEAQYNAIVTYTCETGYEHTGGDLNRTCKADGSWSGDALVCSSKLLVYYARCWTGNL